MNVAVPQTWYLRMVNAEVGIALLSIMSYNSLGVFHLPIGQNCSHLTLPVLCRKWANNLRAKWPNGKSNFGRNFAKWWREKAWISSHFYDWKTPLVAVGSLPGVAFRVVWVMNWLSTQIKAPQICLVVLHIWLKPIYTTLIGIIPARAEDLILFRSYLPFALT